MLRNVTDLSAAFGELGRVLKPGGRLACLDLTPPRGPLHGLFGFYIGRIVPLLGGVVSGHYFAYRWLGQSLRPHPDADTMAAIMRAAGLGEVGYRLTGFGTVAIHYARQARRVRALPAAASTTGAICALRAMDPALLEWCRRLVACRSVTAEGTRQIAELCASEMLAPAGIAARLIPFDTRGRRAGESSSRRSAAANRR